MLGAFKSLNKRYRELILDWVGSWEGAEDSIFKKKRKKQGYERVAQGCSAVK